MELSGEMNGNKYTMTFKDRKLKSITVESLTSCHRSCYQRGPVKGGLLIKQELFKETVLAICQKSLAKWTSLEAYVASDEEFGQSQLEEIFKEHFLL